MSTSITPFALLLQLPLDALLIEFLFDRGLALSLDTIADADGAVVAERTGDQSAQRLNRAASLVIPRGRRLAFDGANTFRVARPLKRADGR